MKNKYVRLIAVFIFMIFCNAALIAVDDDNKSPNYSYYDKMKQDLTVLQNYLYKKASSVFDIDFGIERMLTRFKADVRKKYPVQERLEPVQIRVGKDLCQSEINFVNNRMPKVSQALKQYFDVDVPLKIALCASGGGNRSMLVTLGFYLGAHDIGLFDAALYSAGVSGSTWTIVPWSYMYATENMSLVDFRDQLVPRLNRTMATVNGVSIPPIVSESGKNVIINNIAKHFAYDQTISSIDIYGGFIGDYTLFPAGESRLDVTWSSIADILEQGNQPLPLGAAVSYKTRESTKTLAEYYWFEVGPFEVGSDQVQAYVPTHAFGSKFYEGKSVKGYLGNAPEYPLSFYEGVFGSVFAVSLHEVMDRVTKRVSFTLLGQTITLPIDLWIRSGMLEFARDTRFAPATFYNYSRGMSDSPITKNKHMSLYDGAMSFNFPLPLVMRPARKVDLVVICDSSVDLESLKLAQIHSLRNGILFPDLKKYTKAILRSKPLTVFNDPREQDYDKNIMTILYCPFIKNNDFSSTFDPEPCMAKDFCNTFNFKYNKSQAIQVIDLVRYNMNDIKNEIKLVMQALQNKLKP